MTGDGHSGVLARQIVGPPDPTLQRFTEIESYLMSARMPWRRNFGWKLEDVCDGERVDRKALGFRGERPFPLRDHRFLDRTTFLGLVQARFQNEIAQAASEGLREDRPECSAARTLSDSQKAIVAFLIVAVLGGAMLFPWSAFILANALITAYFLFAIFFRIYLMAQSPRGKPADFRGLDETNLPVVTILLPLLNDAEILPVLMDSIAQLDYPKEKLDIKLLFEEEDLKTQEAFKNLNAPAHFQSCVVPAGAPQTKPRACNFGARLALGEYIVIYDAEDRPAPDQLKKAVHHLSTAANDVACVQAKLFFYNANENWLTRQFALEYALWFDWLLPALQRIGAPIPLGGTSNFFRRDALRAAGFWDPYNVTEDADLGLRLAALGYRTEILDSVTEEEANCRLPNWIRQRSRWIKGYMQTWLVQMRRPQRIVRACGWIGLLATTLFIAGNFVSALANPILWTIFFLWLATDPLFVARLFPEPLLTLNLFAFFFGNLAFIVMAAIAPLRKGLAVLSLNAFTAPFYWALASLGAYKGLYGLFVRPHYWEKTAHALSAQTQSLLQKSLMKNCNDAKHSAC